MTKWPLAPRHAECASRHYECGLSIVKIVNRIGNLCSTL